MSIRTSSAWVGAVLMIAGAVVATAGRAEKAPEPQLPHCSAPIGTLAVHEPQSQNPWGGSR